MRVLAIDPGYGRCGIAVLERSGTKDILVYSSCVETDAKSDFAARLTHIVEACRSALTSHVPDCVALEKLFFSKNRTTAMKVAEVRGAILALAAGAGLEVFEYAPSTVKGATAGYGSADKRAIAHMLHLLVKMDDRARLDDEYDAIAIGLTHLATRSASMRAV